jgi:hypothetical protein
MAVGISVCLMSYSEMSRGRTAVDHESRAFLTGFDTLVRGSDPTLPLWSGIDPYGHTYFNGIQAKVLLVELAQLKATVSNPDERLVVEQLAKMAQTCADGIHRYLHFVGD